jgi:hypothetical protein
MVLLTSQTWHQVVVWANAAWRVLWMGAAWMLVTAHSIIFTCMPVLFQCHAMNKGQSLW